MAGDKVRILLQTADRTRKAEVVVPRTMSVSDIIRASTKRWFLTFGHEYQVFNLTTHKQLLPSDTLYGANVQDGDILMVQPLATHGSN